jgi:toxin secretion/phage lysis holin
MNYVSSLCHWSFWEAVITGCIGIGLFLLGPDQTALVIAYIFLLLDTLTGLLVAIHKKELSSSKFGRVITKFIVITTAFIVGNLLFIFEPLLYPMKYIVASGIIFKEALSIFENSYKLNIGFPESIAKFLQDYIEKNKPTN